MKLFFTSYLRVALIMSCATLAIDCQAMNKRKFDNLHSSNQAENQGQKKIKLEENNDENNTEEDESSDESTDSDDEAVKQLLEQEKEEALSKRYEELIENVKKSDRIIDFGTLLKNNEKIPVLVTLDEVSSALNTFIEQQSTKLSEPKMWLDGKTPEMLQDESYKEPEAFLPFLGKQILGKDEKFIFFGDLHGDIHSLLKFLRDHVQGFNIKDSKTRLVFLGDFVDRGSYGIEVIYLIAQLANHNPGKVIICRGNHEDIDKSIGLFKDYYQQGSFINQLLCKYHDKTKITKVVDTLRAFFNLLPSAYLIGCQNEKTEKYEYALCCHGSIEPRHRLDNIVDDERSEVYEYIDKLLGTEEFKEEKKQQLDKSKFENDEGQIKKYEHDIERNKNYEDIFNEGDIEISAQKKEHELYFNLYTLTEKIVKELNEAQYDVTKIKEQFDLIKKEHTDHKSVLYNKPILVHLCNALQTIAKDNQDEKNYEPFSTFCNNVSALVKSEYSYRWNNVEETNITPDHLGYLWGYYDEDSQGVKAVAFDKQVHKICYGKRLVDLTFQPTYKGNRIKASIKGHQHHAHTIEKLKEFGGIWKFFNEDKNQWDQKNVALTLNQNDIILTDAPASFFGLAFDKGWGTYAKLSFADEFENWKFEPVKIDVF